MCVILRLFVVILCVSFVVVHLFVVLFVFFVVFCLFVVVRLFVLILQLFVYLDIPTLTEPCDFPGIEPLHAFGGFRYFSRHDAVHTLMLSKHTHKHIPG